MKDEITMSKSERNPLDTILKKYGYHRSSFRKFKKALIRIKPSTIPNSGVGVFAVRDLEIGTIVGDVKLMCENLFFSWEEFKKIDKESQEVILSHCVGTPDGFYAPIDINHIPISWHINHKCDCNIGFDALGNFIVIKRIKKDRELFYDYGLSVCDPEFRMVCNCGNRKCRRIVTGNDWKNPSFRKEKFKYMAPELKEYVRTNS